MDKNLTAHSQDENVLLSFAHRAEARCFLQEYKSKLIQNNFYHLETPFESLNLFLLITGEGQQESLTNLSYYLGKFPKINKIINYGVCGLLRKDSSLKINDLVSVKTVYSDELDKLSNKMSFKSFTLTSPSINSFDLVTTKERVLKREKADYLDNFAPLVDRELWAQAFVANQWDIEIQSFKVISDYADGEFCEQVKELSPIWSDLLLRHFIKSQESPQDQDSIQSDHSHIHSFLNREERAFFHITLSQERSLERILLSHHIKGHQFIDLKELINLNQIKEQKIRSKDRTKELIKRLSESLNPMGQRLRKKLKTITYSLEKLSAQVKHDQDFDKEKLHLSITLQTPDDFQRLGKALIAFPYSKWSAVLRGEDV